MKISGYLLIVLAFSFFTAFPQKASAHEHIPFYATNDNSSEVQICC